MPSRVGLIPGSQEFLHGLQAECRALGILLILDEVISLRLATTVGRVSWASIRI